MINIPRQVSRNARWSIAQTVISAIVLFLLYKFLLRELGTEQLGLWALILATTSLARIGELGFASATMRFIGRYKGEGDDKAAAEVLETSLMTISLPFLGLTVLAYWLAQGLLYLVVSAPNLALAKQILPWALLSLWLGVTSSLIQSAIDGCGRMDRKNMILIGSNVIYLCGAVFLTKGHGLEGVAIAQAIQTLAALVGLWFIARWELKALPWLPYRWRRHRFNEIAAFAFSMQIGSIIGLLIEPITKALLSRYVGLSFLAFYEMANQVITRIRSVLVAGFQAIVPQFSTTNSETAHESLFLQTEQKTLDIGLPFISIVIMSFKVISLLWIGKEEQIFITSGHILSGSWLIVTLLMPAYFYLVGTGQGRPIAVGQVASLLGTVALGVLGSYANTKYGILLGCTTALILANIYLYKHATNRLFKSRRIISASQLLSNKNSISVLAYLSVLSIFFAIDFRLETPLQHALNFTVCAGMTAGIALIAANIKRSNK
jgi:O-antigen/teichoic acid export membrane protein